MDQTTILLCIGAAVVAFAVIMFLREQAAIKRRKAARGGREVDVSDLIAFGSAAAKAERDDKKT
ncbi:hypothetical protein [Nereida ignava]|uniref:hypothetical protein n=1 Tax=Nereida ignava TaxID=282199 RepID=UPI00065E0D4D|nr:hypothetical protein [Nereida ignava]